MKRTEGPTNSLRFPDNTGHGKILWNKKGLRRYAHQLINKARVRRDGRVIVWWLSVLAGQRRVVFYDIVPGEMIEVDSSSIPAEENAGEGQEISQRFREVVHTLHCLDEGVYCEVPAITIAGTG